MKPEDSLWKTLRRLGRRQAVCFSAIFNFCQSLEIDGYAVLKQDTGRKYQFKKW